MIVKYKAFVTHWFSLVVGLTLGIHLAGGIDCMNIGRWIGLVIVLIGVPAVLMLPYYRKNDETQC